MNVAATTLFNGLAVTSESREHVNDWARIIRVFLRCIDREHGHYIRFPWGGCEREQPIKTMEAFDLLQQAFVRCIHNSIETAKSKINVRR